MPDPTLLDNPQPFAPLAATSNPLLRPLAQLPPDTQQALVEHGDKLAAMQPPGTSVGPMVEPLPPMSGSHRYQPGQGEHHYPGLMLRTSGDPAESGGSSPAQPATDLAPMGAPSATPNADSLKAMKPLARPAMPTTPMAPTPAAAPGKEPFIGDKNWDQYAKWEYDKDQLQKQNPGMDEAEAEHILTSRHGADVAQTMRPMGPTANQAERTRLTDPTLQSSKPGWQQIQSKPLRILAGIGNGLGSVLAPRIAAAIPGTDLHHAQLVDKNANANKVDEGERDQASKRKLEEAQAENQESIPELKRTQADLAKVKETELETSHRNTEENNRTKVEAQIDSALAQHGMKRDAQTKEIVPQSYEEMSEPLQAVHDLKAAQAEQAQATAALKKAQAENAPAAAKLAQARLDSAAQAHSIALRRLGLSEEQTEGRLFGTHNGVALPGSIQTDAGTPVGSAFQQNVRPTGQERNKADLANSAHQQIQDIKGIVAKRPDIFGPAAGRKTEFTVWLGSQDPDAQRFRAARTIAGDHLAGVFGGRSEAALQALDSAIGHFKDNPAAMQAGLDQLDKANAGFQKAGTPRTTGSHAADAANVDPAVKDYADKYFGGDAKKAQAAIDQQKKK